MHIWVDADACPGVIKDILFRVAERTQLPVTLVASQLMRVPGSRFIRALQVPAGADVADAEIVERVSPGDIVVTGDIPLAALVLEKGGLPLNPRGDWYTNACLHGRTAWQRRRYGWAGGVQPGRQPQFRQCP
jgi:uncharacterized protein YaiI (UPF0178 family)